MNSIIKNNKKELLALALVCLLFLLSSYLSRRYIDNINAFITLSHGLGLIIFFFIELAAIVIAPISSLPTLPLAVSLWGSFWVAVVSYLAWLVGSGIAFILARQFGHPLVIKMVKLDYVKKIEKSLNRKNLFLTIIILRIVLPIDMLSYALGLFSSIPFPSYIIATAIGILPFAFIYSYATTLPLYYQALIVLIGLFLGWWLLYKGNFI